MVVHFSSTLLLIVTYLIHNVDPFKKDLSIRSCKTFTSNITKLLRSVSTVMT